MAATLYYLPFGGRGEAARCIAAAGGIPLIEGGTGGDIDKSEFGSPSSTPLLAHGDLKMSQSVAIENYLSLLAFPDLTPPQRAIDYQLNSIKEDVCGGYVKIFFYSPELKEDKVKAAEEAAKVASKWYPVIEKLCPADGFFNGPAYPTAADIAVKVICDCVIVFEAGNKLGGVSWATYPKMRALANRAAEHPSLKDYLANSTSMTSNPYNL